MSNRQRHEVKGVAAPDPTLTPGALGGRVRFESIAVRLDGADKAGHLPMTLLRGAFLTVSIRDEHSHYTWGSGFMVGPGLALCAKHVIQDHLGALASGGASLVCEAPSDAGLLLWAVRRHTVVPDSDMVLLGLSLNCEVPKDHRFSTLHMSTRMPIVGEELLLVGFSALEGRYARASTIEVSGQFRYTRGKVIDIYPERRDTQLPGPTLAVECGAFGGMSGGPVFDAQGNAIGLVSKSIGDEVAFVSHLWPALTRALADPIWPAGLKMPAGTLLQLGSKWGVHIQRPDAFQLVVANGELCLIYDQWS